MLQHDELHGLYPWLSKDLFGRVLLKQHPNGRIKSYSVKSALAPGENFTSQMIRASVTYTVDGTDDLEQETRFIIKAGHSNPKLRATFEDGQLFHREVLNYQKILPAVYKLLTEIGDDSQLSAKYDSIYIELTRALCEPFSHKFSIPQVF